MLTEKVRIQYLLRGHICYLLLFSFSVCWLQRQKLVFYVGEGKGEYGSVFCLSEIPPLPPSTNLILIFNLEKDRTVRNKKSLFEELTKNRKIKKYIVADVTSERVKNVRYPANILHTATTGTDATIYFFIFRPFSSINKDFFHGSSVFNEVN